MQPTVRVSPATLLPIILTTFAAFPACTPTHVLPGETHLRNIRQLTHGGQNAEAYLSFDERRLVYQAQRGDMQCDQIYVMDLDGKNRQRVSSGEGATTCAYFLPAPQADGAKQRVVYASTHLAGQDCPPPPDRSQGYVWQLYDSYDIFSANADGSGDVRRLTDAPGYDAEATLSPRGDRIVFTSTRDGDPELYTMNLDGSDQRRLTFSRGYDGGAFFSADGSEIVWRASRPNGPQEEAAYRELIEKDYVRPTALEVFVMNADGTNIRQVTDFGKASFAPFFHPDAERIIFSSNLKSESGRDFDLFMIRKNGSDLEQITHNPTFDGFPMFTRDGRTLVFASNRSNAERGETNIFVADWVD